MMADSFGSGAANKPMGHVHAAALPVGVPENHTFQRKIDAILKKDDETAKQESNDPVNLYQPSLYFAAGNKYLTRSDLHPEQTEKARRAEKVR